MRGVRQRENGSWVVERVIDGKRMPKTVKTKREAVRLKNADKARRRAEKALPSSEAPARRRPSAFLQARPRRLPKDALQLENGDWVVVVDGAVLAEDTGPKGRNKRLAAAADEPIFEARYSSDAGCFKEIWQSLGVKADSNFTVQLASRRGQEPGIAAVIALLRNINQRLKRVEKRLARR